MGFCGWQFGKLAKDIRDFWCESFEWAVFSVFDVAPFKESSFPIPETRFVRHSTPEDILANEWSRKRTSTHHIPYPMFQFCKIWFLSRVPFFESDAAQIRSEACKNGEIL